MRLQSDPGELRCSTAPSAESLGDRSLLDSDDTTFAHPRALRAALPSATLKCGSASKLRQKAKSQAPRRRLFLEVRCRVAESHLSRETNGVLVRILALTVAFVIIAPQVARSAGNPQQVTLSGTIRLCGRCDPGYRHFIRSEERFLQFQNSILCG